MPTDNENRPGSPGAVHEKRSDGRTCGTATTMLPDAASMLAGIHVVVVAHSVDGETRFRRRVFYNLPAAQRAVDKATERGQRAVLVLCRLDPVESPAGVGRWCA